MFRLSGGFTLRLEQIVTFFPGPNTLELKKKYNQYKIYTNDDLEKDLHKGFYTTNVSVSYSPILEAGDIVTNTMTNRTAIVSPESTNKVIPQNIIKLSFIECGDAWYLCYLLNESQTVKHQLYNIMEGSILRRVTLRNLRQLEIKLPNLGEQQEIGKLYRLLLIKERQQNEYQNKLKQAILEIINKEDINGEYNQ